MTPEGIQKLKKFLIKHEGLKLYPYMDTQNNVTIGVGHNLTIRGLQNSSEYKNGITYQKAMQDLDDDIDWFLNKLSQFDWFNKLNEDRQIVIVDMAFNMGLQNILEFTHMIAAIERDDYDTAAFEMDNSVWIHQVQPERALDDLHAMRIGIITI